MQTDDVPKHINGRKVYEIDDYAFQGRDLRILFTMDDGLDPSTDCPGYAAHIDWHKAIDQHSGQVVELPDDEALFRKLTQIGCLTISIEEGIEYTEHYYDE